MTTVKELAEELNMTVQELWEFDSEIPWQEGASYVLADDYAEYLRGACQRAEEISRDI